MDYTKLSIREFISKARDKHGDRFTYDLVQYKNMTDKITVQCIIHGDIITSPRDHLSQKWGCKKCYSDHQSKNKSWTIDEFMKHANKIHKNRYDYSQTRYVNSSHKVTIICKLHGPFIVNPMDHIHANTGCKTCSMGVPQSYNMFVQQANQVHKNSYDYHVSKWTNPYTKITIGCKIHGQFDQRPYDHIQGKKCPECAKDLTRQNRIKDGRAIDPLLKDPFELYRDTVRKLSNENFCKYYHDINPNNLRRGLEWHLDHIVSIAAGFINKIPAEQIADPKNLRIISAKENRSKNVYSCDAVSTFDPNHIKTKELGELAYENKRKKHSNTYEITDIQTGDVEIVELLIEWCKERDYSVSSARWSASYSKVPFKERYIIKKITFKGTT